MNNLNRLSNNAVKASMNTDFPGVSKWASSEIGECTLTFDCKKQLCRLCANAIHTSTYIFNTTGKELSLATKINMCLPVTVKTTDDLPKQLCSSCVIKLNDCYDFSNLCLQAEEQLICKTEEYFNSIYLNSVSSELVQNLNPVDQCYTDEDHYCCPLCIEGNMLVQGQSTSEEVNKYIEVLNPTDRSASSGQINSSYVIVKNDISINDIDVYCKNRSGISMLINANHTKHKSVFSNKDKIKADKKTIFICRLCGDLLETVDLSYQHSLSHVEQDLFPCILCTSNFTSESVFKDHFKEHVYKYRCNDELKKKKCATQYFKCFDCSEVFYTRKRFMFHRQIHEQLSSSYRCEPCREEFEDETWLYHHVCSEHNDERIFICGKSFITCNRLAIHMREHLGNDDQLSVVAQTKNPISIANHGVKLKRPAHQCDGALNRPFDNQSTIVEQAKSREYHPTKKPAACDRSPTCYCCSECHAAFPSIELALCHGQMHADFYVESKVVVNVFKCEYCETYFSSWEDWKQHIQQHSGDSPYICLECKLLFQSYYNVMEHKKQHKIPGKTSCISFSVPVFFLCELCAKHFKQWEYLYIHRQTHFAVHKATKTLNADTSSKKLSQYPSLDQSHLCEICGQSFLSDGEVKHHRRLSHLMQSGLECPDCGRRLANRAGLAIHQRLHTGEMPFACDVCGRRFRQSSGLYTHRRTHTRDHPYCCELCGRSFPIKSELDNHRRSRHTKERPFQCQVCGKAFLTSGVYYQHKALHTGVRKYKCVHCEKAFSRWNALRLHIRTHTGEKPYVCAVCSRGFAQKGDMRKHMKTQHNVTQVNTSSSVQVSETVSVKVSDHKA